MRRWTAAVAALVVFLATSAESQAAFLTYAASAIGSGSLNGTDYANRLVTVSLTADTAANTASSSVITQTQTVLATIRVQGFADVTIAASAFVNRGENVLGIFASAQTTTSGQPLDILDVRVDPGNYNLDAPIGPLTGGTLVNSQTTFLTSGGQFTLVSTSGLGTFAASNAVPEPASLALLGLGLTGVAAGGLARNRQRA